VVHDVPTWLMKCPLMPPSSTGGIAFHSAARCVGVLVLTTSWSGSIVIHVVNHVSVFAALGDPNRARMVTHLATAHATVSQLARETSISLSATLKHLAVLEEAGLVRRAKRGRTVTVSLRPETLVETEAWFHRTHSFWTTQLGQLAASFDTPPPSPHD
jgi:DNA-binding transcriptional ArsR family regulator